MIGCSRMGSHLVFPDDPAECASAVNAMVGMYEQPHLSQGAGQRQSPRKKQQKQGQGKQKQTKPARSTRNAKQVSLN